MKARHVLVAYCRPALLICALQLGGGALAGEGKEIEGKEIIVTDDQYLSVRTVASQTAESTPPNGSTARKQRYAGTRYRNGGHFGDENSDEKQENTSR